MSNLIPGLKPAEIMSSVSLLAASGRHFNRFSLTAPRVEGIHIIWENAAANFGGNDIFYSSCLENPTVPATGGTVDLEQWFAETGIAFTGATAVAVGSEIIHLGNNGARWLLWESDPTANSTVSSSLFGR